MSEIWRNITLSTTLTTIEIHMMNRLLGSLQIEGQPDEISTELRLYLTLVDDYISTQQMWLCINTLKVSAADKEI